MTSQMVLQKIDREAREILFYQAHFVNAPLPASSSFSSFQNRLTTQVLKAATLPTQLQPRPFSEHVYMPFFVG